jgi:hypothetical protein
MTFRTAIFSGALLLALAVVVAFPLLVNAQGLVTCNPTAGSTQPVLSECGVCEFLATAGRVINFMLIGIAAPAAAFFVAWGAVLIGTAGGNAGQVDKGKGHITAAVIGLAVGFTGWLLVAQFLHVLTAGSPTTAPWRALKCGDQNLFISP